MGGYSFIDHTGDVGVKIYGETLEELFRQGAMAMFEVISGDLSRIRGEIGRDIHVEGEDMERLLVSWLSELNYLFNVEGELYSAFDVHRVGDGFVDAKVWGERIDPERHSIRTEIKAVTYHGIYVKRVGDIWEAQIIFDV
jgi:SHS2 domain-containing protein